MVAEAVVEVEAAAAVVAEAGAGAAVEVVSLAVFPGIQRICRPSSVMEVMFGTHRRSRLCNRKGGGRWPKSEGFGRSEGESPFLMKLANLFQNETAP